MAQVRKRKNLSLHDFKFPLPHLYESHFKSYNWFLEEGLKKALDLINPITDSLEKMWKLEFLDYYFKEPTITEQSALDYDLTYAQPMFVKTRLTSLKDGTVKTQDVYFADIPKLTEKGYFIVNGVVRIVRHQIVRAEGVLFQEAKNTNPGDINHYMARLIPNRGAWYSIEINKKGVITIALMRQRVKILYTTLLRALKGYSDAEIYDMFKDIDRDTGYIKKTLDLDKTSTKEDAIMDIYSKLRPNESATLERATRYVRSFFFNSRRFYLGEVGRYQLNKKLGLSFKEPKLEVKDLIEIARHLILVNQGKLAPDDIDSLMNRRIRSVGELMYEALEDAILRLERNVKDRMSRVGANADIMPSSLLNTKLITSQLIAFLGMGQLSKFMEQENIFCHIEELRKVTAKGPGGLGSKNAGYSVRDIHFSHYGRLGAVTTPEGQSAGLVLHLAVYARLNKYGFIETPFRKLKKEVKNRVKDLTNKILREELKIGDKVIEKGTFIDEKLAKEIAKLSKKTIKVYPFLTDEVEYLSYHDEINYKIGQSVYKKDKYGNFLPNLVTLRHNGEYILESIEHMDYVDVKPWQIGSLGLTLIPFVDRTYSYRAMMGSNMQRQALPLIFPEAPLVGTGMEAEVAKQSMYTIFSDIDGKVTRADANHVVIKNSKTGQTRVYKLSNFERTNDNTVVTQKVMVSPGEIVKKGDLIIDGPSTDMGELALGKNVLVAVMPYEGLNYDDGFVISERFLRDDLFTTVQIKMYTQDLRETLTGPEVLTYDIPNVNKKLLANLTESGVVRVGAMVEGGDILAGIVSQKAEKNLSPEESLLRAVFGEVAKEVKNNSLRMPYGSKGVVIKTQVLSKDNGDPLPSGVLKRVKIWVAELKTVSYGDKFSSFYGDKGTVSKILPIEDMPYTEDGTPVDVVMTPFLVKRMNIGILFQLMYSNLAKELGIHLAVPNFEPLDDKWVREQMEKIGLAKFKKQTLYDGKTGKKFENAVTVGWRYFLRLKHIAADKMHARSTGPYSVVTQQPVGGKSHRGGQRFGEMEVWALEAYGAAYTLQEMLTIKSDDVRGRTSAYKAIIQGEPIKMENVPETFNVLLKELNSLGINVEINK